MPFHPSLTPPDTVTGPRYWFLFQNDKLLVDTHGDAIALPDIDTVSELTPAIGKQVFLGTVNGHSCIAAELPGQTLPEGSLKFQNLRRLFGQLNEELTEVAGYALQLINWDKESQYCGKCAFPLKNDKDERAKGCDRCGAIVYPRINPCIIVAVVKEDKILLARSSRFPNTKLYSVLAGYVEAGETLEACVKREVKEEVNIRIDKLNYFGSQPWPFSSSLMVGFTAEYAGGTIRTDQTEIVDAGWYAADELPLVPGWGSIAGQLIDWFKKKAGG